MVRRQRKTCRWPTTLLNALLLPSLVMHAAHAADMKAPTNESAANPVLFPDGGEQVAGAEGTDLYLDVTLNGASAGLAHFGLRDGQLWASAASLRQLGFNLPEGTPDPVRLQSLQGMKTEYDAGRQAVTIVAPLSLLKLSTTVLNDESSKHPVATVSPGLLLNYNVYGTYGEHGANSLSGFAELRAFNSWGVFSTTSLSQAVENDHGQRNNTSVRLDTSWSTSFPDSLVTVRVGDTLTDALTWTRSTRIGGLQIGTNFALQPYLVTAPLPSFMGQATLPSDVQLYVNGLRQYSGQVPAGPFQLNTLPNINGAGNAQVVLTNALGQTTTLNFSMYGEHQLLQQGLSDWSAELGYVRENYGLASFDYGHDPVASGTWRRGMTDRFTMEAHAELTKGLSNEGLGGSLLLGSAGGVLSASVAHSANAGSSGQQYGLGYSWDSARFNFGLNGTRTTGSYRDVATLYGTPPPRLSGQVFASYNFDRFGSLNVSYLHLQYPQLPSSRYATASWFKSISRALSLNLSVNQDLNHSSNRIIALMATLSLDNNLIVSGDIQRTGSHTGVGLNAVQPLPSQGGWGWRASLSGGDNQNGGQAEVDYLGRYGQLQAGAYDVGSTRYGYGSAMGSLVLMGGDVFASRMINDGFAVISTDGVAGVPVNLQNNPIGVTDSHGMLLVTPLNAYQNNKISIDPMNLPADLRIGSVNSTATPTDRAGTLVRFDISPVRAASVILVDGAGKPLPVGSLARLRGHAGEPAMVGFDGGVYMDTLDAHNELDVEMPTGTCHASFDYTKQSSAIPQIGPLTCHEVSP